ncbi:MAG TPA: hypothetical protein VIC00_06055 [Candidatus Acidoferrales bacterium]|jgi:hypothetical protein
MPFIRGRYHINAIAGEALEAAREAEAALRALEQAAQDHESARETGNADDDGESAQSGRVQGTGNAAGDDEFGAQDAADNAAAQNGGARGPIRRVEIEAAELVPAHSGRAERGMVARVHRGTGATAGNEAANAGGSGRRTAAGPETHVFSSHGDMLNFLRDEFAKDARKNSTRAAR